MRYRQNFVVVNPSALYCAGNSAEKVFTQERWLMMKDDVRRDRITIWMRRVARLWSFPIIVYALLLFGGYTWSWVTTGVADPYAVEDVSPIEALPPIFMFVSILGLGLAWRWERWGSLIALGFQVATLLTLILHRPLMRDFPRSAVPYGLVVIVAIPGALFLMCSRREGA